MILSYELEYSDKTEGGEEVEILIPHDKSLAAFKKNLVKSKFPYTNAFNHEGLTVISAMHHLTSRVFDYLEINYTMEFYQIIAYTQCILRGVAL